MANDRDRKEARFDLKVSDSSIARVHATLTGVIRIPLMRYCGPEKALDFDGVLGRKIFRLVY